MPTLQKLRISLYEPGTTPEPVVHSPTTWKDVQVKVSRNLTYHGVDRDYSNSMPFVEDGATFLRRKFYSKGRNAKARILIETLNSTQLDYKRFIDTAIAFTKSLDDQDTFTVQAMEDGAVAMVKAYEDTEFEIPIDGPEVVTVDVKAMLIQGEVRWLSTYPPSFPTSTSQDPINAQRGGSFYFIKTTATTFDNQDGPPLTAQTQAYQAAPLTGNWLATTYLLSPVRNIYNLKLSGTLDFSIKNESGSNESYSVRISKIAVGSQQDTLLKTVAIGTLAGGGRADIKADFAASLGDWLPGEKLLLHFTWTGLSGTGSVKWANNQTIKATFLNYATAFSVTGLRAIEVFKRLIAKITKGKYTAESELLSNRYASYVDGVDNRPYDTIITSGIAIRGAISSGNTVPVIKIKLKDFFTSTNVWWNTGLSTEKNIVRIEKKGRYYNADLVTAELAEPSKVQVTDATDFVYNKVVIGYPVKDYDGLNGRDEINTTETYTAETESIGVLELLSPIRCDSYGIFYTWAKYATKETTDSPSDNDNFAIEIESAPSSNGHYATLKLPGTRGGVIDPENMMNWGLTPARCFARHGSYIRSVFFGLDGEVFTFQTTDRNAEAYSTLAAGYFKECADRPFNSLAPALFQPFTFTSEVISPQNLLDALDAAPYGVIRFPYRGSTFDFYCMDAGVKPVSPSSYTFKLLSSPKNDLQKLVV